MAGTKVISVRLDEETLIKLNYLSSKHEKSKADIIAAAVEILDVILDARNFKNINIKEVQ